LLFNAIIYAKIYIYVLHCVLWKK